MDVFDAILTRRSVSKVRPDPISQDTIKQLLHAAVQAPNHFRVRPWRFIVIQGDARTRLGDVMAASLLRRSPESNKTALDVERGRPLRAPVIIAIAVDEPSEPKVIELENICAAAAAAENLLLAAHALGLGAMWRTGPAAYASDVKEFLGLSQTQHLIAFIYVGYPVDDLGSEPRPSFDDRTIWMK